MGVLLGVKMGVLSGLNLRVPLKWGILLVAPKPYLLPLLPFYLRDFLYSLTFYSLTSIDTHSAAIAVAYNRNSHLNLATPSKFFASTEILEIEAIILALKQSTKNNIKRLHITVDNLSALHFATQTATLTRETSTYLQEKIEYNHYYEESYTEIKHLISNFSHLSTSHTKAHTNSLSTLSQLNCLADRLARSCQTSFPRMI